MSYSFGFANSLISSSKSFCGIWWLSCMTINCTLPVSSSIKYILPLIVYTFFPILKLLVPQLYSALQILQGTIYLPGSASGLSFGGLPILILRMDSRADLSYRTARDMGSIPAFWRRLRTLSGLILSTSAFPVLNTLGGIV